MTIDDRAAAHQAGRGRRRRRRRSRPIEDHRQADQAEQDREDERRRSRRRRVGVGAKACRAAIGGTRVERSAGISEETKVTTTPTSSETIDRPRLQHQAGGRQVDPERFEERVEQRAR